MAILSPALPLFVRYFIAATPLVAAALGVVLFRRLRTRDFLDRLVPASLPFLAGAVAIRIFLGVAARPFNEWDTVRIAPVIAFAHGYPLYPTPETGALTSFCYGPVTALLYLPLAFCPTPTVAVLAGAVTSVLCFLGPVFWICMRQRGVGPPHGVANCGRHAPRDEPNLIGFLAFTGIVFLLPSLSYSLFSPAHDAAALGLGAMATGALCGDPAKLSLRSLVLSSLFAVLAVWAKQTMVALMLALPLVVLVIHGPRNSGRYLGLLAMWGVASIVVFAIAFDPTGLILNLVEIPLRHVRDKKLTDAIWFFQFELPVVAMLLVFGLVYYYSLERGPATAKRGGAWLPFVIVGAMQLPAALAAYTKLGGGENAFSFSLYYLSIGSILLVLEIGTWAVAGDERYHGRVVRSVLLAACSTLVFAPVRPLKNLEDANYPDPLAAAFQFEKKNPGRAYFPWNTLSVEMASGNVYHAEDGILSLAMAGIDLAVEQFHSHLPPHAKLLALPPNYPAYWTNRRIQRVLPEYHRQVTLEELPGWAVYERDLD
jgi:hypothetical protein